jgi:hypothetical protein
MKGYIGTRRRIIRKWFCCRLRTPHWIFGSLFGRFGNFFNHVDSFVSEAFLFVTSGGVAATKSADEKIGSMQMPLDEALGSEPEEGEVRNGYGEEG